MTTLAVLSSAAFVGLVVATLMGRPPTLRRSMPSTAQQERDTWLAQAGVRATSGQFRAMSVGIGLVAFVLLTLVTSTPAVSLVPALGVASIPRWVYARRRTARLRELQESWPDGIRDLLAAISAGTSLHQAILALEDTGPLVIRQAFGRYPALARVLGTSAALEVVKEELADPTSDRILEVLILANERGGHLLADILRDLAEATTRDVRTSEGIATASLEQRINARAVFVLPWLLLVVLTLQDISYRNFYRSPGGVLTVAAGGLLSLVGVVIVSRLSQEPVEQRVLGTREPDASEVVW